MLSFSLEPLRIEIDDQYIEDQLSEFGSRSVVQIGQLMRTTPRTGRTYKRRRRTHVASSPGNPPAIDTGRLLQSLAFDSASRSVEIGATIEYAGFVHDENDRPYLDLGVKKVFSDWPEFMDDFLVEER